ncbi:hypothetical protein KP509_1Z304700 [Ceratopteris richardii]|nr:hypothetical protein KP509_1Z304700 [Ceratopteris richardii]
MGKSLQKIILLKDVTSVRKARTVGLFPNAIEIVAWGKKSFFASFLSRDEAYRLIIEGWFRHSKNAIMDSDTQSNASVPVVQPATTQDQHEICESESSFESRENMEAPSEPATEAEIAVENSGELNDSDMTEIAMQLTDSCNVLGAASVHAEESLAARTESALGIEDDKAPEGIQFHTSRIICALSFLQFLLLIMSRNLNNSHVFYQILVFSFLVYIGACNS